jgi:hypothetical protein
VAHSSTFRIIDGFYTIHTHAYSQGKAKQQEKLTLLETQLLLLNHLVRLDLGI